MDHSSSVNILLAPSRRPTKLVGSGQRNAMPGEQLHEPALPPPLLPLHLDVPGLLWTDALDLQIVHNIKQIKLLMSSFTRTAKTYPKHKSHDEILCVAATIC